jgi:CheY-like chemotaxis protein
MHGRSAVDVLKRQVLHLTRLVDDLLDVSRITRGRIRLQKAPLDLHSIVVQALESVEPLVAQKKHHLTVSSRAGKLFVEGDSARLIQCVTNLLTNAVKYTEAGGQIHLQAQADQSDAVICVSDNGIGIPEELMPRIFGLFVQNSRSLDRSEGGLGIGLSVVEKLMEMHGGSVSATSAGPGKGSAFELRLPLINAQSPPPQQVVPTATAAKRLLVVDDNVDAANSIAELLQMDGHEVCVAHSAAAALAKFADFRPDVVLLDIGLPDEDGYRVVQQLRGSGGTAQIIALTGHGQPADLERSQQSGFDAHLIKPVDIVLLRKVIRA